MKNVIKNIMLFAFIASYTLSIAPSEESDTSGRGKRHKTKTEKKAAYDTLKYAKINKQKNEYQAKYRAKNTEKIAAYRARKKQAKIQHKSTKKMHAADSHNHLASAHAPAPTKVTGKRSRAAREEKLIPVHSSHENAGTEDVFNPSTPSAGTPTTDIGSEYIPSDLDNHYAYLNSMGVQPSLIPGLDSDDELEI